MVMFLGILITSCKKDTCENGVQDEDETGIDCGGSCSFCEPDFFPTITYPMKGGYESSTDDNILKPEINYYSSDTFGLSLFRFSFGAILQNDASLMIRWTTLTGTTGPSLIPLPADSWEEHGNSGDLIQTFYSTKQDTLDGEFWVETAGSALIEFYENGADTSISAPYYKIVYY